jgi:CubicO group peptidase (beta-lactamase class C family)
MKKWVVSLILLAATGISLSTGQSRDYWPTLEWRKSTPEKQGLDAAKLRDMTKDVRKNIPQATCIMVVRHGYVVLEEYWNAKPEQPMQMWSATKGIISILLGISKDGGLIQDIDRPMLDYLPELKEMSHSSVGKITLHHLLTMSSGLGTSFSSPDQGLLEATIRFPPSHDAGSRFDYNESDPAIISLIISKVAQEPIPSFAKRVLFEPLGINDFKWDGGKTPGGSVDLFLRPRDMAKIGYLYLNDGIWDGTQIVSSSWVRQSVSKQIDVPERDLPKEYQYGLLWWLYKIKSHSAFFSLGIGGQIIYVIPALDIVYVSTSKSSIDSNPELFKMPERYIVPAVLAK